MQLVYPLKGVIVQVLPKNARRKFFGDMCFSTIFAVYNKKLTVGSVKHVVVVVKNRFKTGIPSSEFALSIKKSS